jgi:hypothetical protein
MITKAISKRVSLVALTALGAGLLSVVPASAVNNQNAGTTQDAVAAEGRLNIASANSTTGAADSTNATFSSLRSVGLVNVSDIGGGTNAGTTQTAVMLNTGTLVVYTAVTTLNTVASIEVIGGTLSSGLSESATTSAMNAASTVFTMAGDSFGADSTNEMAVAVKPNTGVTSMTVRLWTKTSSTTASMNATPTQGTLGGQITVSLVTASTAGALSTTYSGLYFYASTSAPATSGAAPADTTTSGYGATMKAGQLNPILVAVKDAFGNRLTSTSALLQVTATNGARVSIAAPSGTAAAGTQSTAFQATSSALADGSLIGVSAPSAAPLTTVVTATYNGTVIGTKTITFVGEVAKVTISAPAYIGSLNHSPGLAGGTKGAAVKFEDAAGNTVYPVASDAYVPTSGFSTSATSSRAVALSTVPTSSATGYVDWTCGAVASSDNIVATYTNISGTVITSNAVKVNCADNAVTYKASMDKASYSPGEIAKLTVSFFDSKGNAANDDYDWNNDMSASSVSTGGGTLVTASTSSDTSALGKATYSIITTQTAGSYQAVVTIPTLNAGIGETQTVSFTVAAAAGVTNAEVLKSIVALIASINKQIQALQKLILKR